MFDDEFDDKDDKLTSNLQEITWHTWDAAATVANQLNQNERSTSLEPGWQLVQTDGRWAVRGLGY